MKFYKKVFKLSLNLLLTTRKSETKTFFYLYIYPPDLQESDGGADT